MRPFASSNRTTSTSTPGSAASRSAVRSGLAIRGRDIAGLGLALVAIIIAAAVLSGIQVLQPATAFDPCLDTSVLFSGSQQPPCPGTEDQTLTGIEGDRLVTVRTDQPTASLIISWQLTVPNTAELINRVRSGDPAATDAEAFVRQVFGEGTVVESYDPVTVQTEEGQSVSAISVQGRLPVPLHALGFVEFELRTATTLDVALDGDYRVLNVQADHPDVIRQDATAFKGTVDGPVFIRIEHGQVDLDAGPPTGGRTTQLDVVIANLLLIWAGLLRFLRDGVAAIPWLFFVLLLRHRHGQYVRLFRIVSLYLLLHVAVSAANILTASTELGEDLLSPDFPQTFTPWQSQGRDTISGGLIILFASALILLPRVGSARLQGNPFDDSIIRLFRISPAPDNAGGSRRTNRWLNPVLLGAAICLLWAGAISWYGQVMAWSSGAGSSETGSNVADASATSLIVFGGIMAATVVLLLFALGVNAVSRLRDRWALPLVVLTAVPLAMLATMTSLKGPLPTTVTLAPVLCTGAAVALSITICIFGKSPARKVPWMALAILIGIVAAWPGAPSSGTPSRTWFDVLSFGVRVDGLSLAVVVIPVVAAVLSGADGERWTAPNLPSVRALAWAVVFIAVTSALSFTAPLTPWCAALGAGVAIFLLPAECLSVATDLLNLDAAEHQRLVTREIKIGNAQRIVNDSRKGLRTKVADGSMPYTEARDRLRPIERDAKLGTSLAVRTESRRRAFGMVASMTPGEAGLCGARWGLLFGLPWMVLSVTAALYVARAPDYPALQTLAAALPLILQWPVWGFVTYYFFPILRGATGLNKSLWFMTGVFLVSTLNTVLSGQQNLQWATIAVSAAQFYSFGVLLGLRADLETLKRFGRTRSELPDVHNLGTAAGVASTIAVATVTAAAAAILAGGIQPFVQQLIPVTPVSQPAQTVQSNGTSQSTAPPSGQPAATSTPR